MSYFLSHWRGTLPLWITVWVNFIGLLILISLLEPRILSSFRREPDTLLEVSLASLFITRLMIFPWQLTGLFRATERDFLAHRNILKTRAIEALGVLSVLFTLVYSLEVIQGAIFYKSEMAFYSRPAEAAGYDLRVNDREQQLLLTGSLEIGISRAVQRKLDAHPGLTSVVLGSPGGQIYEGRGLARLFMRRNLDTYVYAECSSACATAFIGGRHRYIAESGKLGFHQYKIDASRMPKIVAFYDPSAEQAKDLELYKERGIEQGFLNSMFSRPPNEIWFPDIEMLLAAGIVNRVVFVPNDSEAASSLIEK